jgi:hypothetical protein
VGGKTVEEARNSNITGTCELLLKCCYYFCLQASQPVRLVIEFLPERKCGHAGRGIRKFYFSNAASKTINDAPCFLINQPSSR